MQGDSGAEGRRGATVERGRCRRKLAPGVEFCGDGADSVTGSDLFFGKALGNGARRGARRVRESVFMRRRSAVLESAVGFLQKRTSRRPPSFHHTWGNARGGSWRRCLGRGRGNVACGRADERKRRVAPRSALSLRARRGFSPIREGIALLQRA